MGVRRRFWVEAALGWLSLSLAMVTVAWHDWIEFLFGVDPDRGSGAAEWLIVALSAAAAITLAGMARAEWRRAAVARSG